MTLSKVLMGALAVVILAGSLLLILIAVFSALHFSALVRVLWGITGAMGWVGGCLIIRDLRAEP